MNKRLARILLKLTRTGTVIRVDTRNPCVALTFDDGPNPDYTPQLLDILEQHHAQATFFMVGQTAAKYPDLVAKVVAQGHVVANHSWDHPSFPTLTGRQRRAQLRRCADVLAPHGQKLFRPPFGHQDPASRLDALCAGYEVIAWNVLAGDWRDWGADKILEKLAGKVQPGNIILLHDGLFSAAQHTSLDRTPTLQVVDQLLSEHADYRFVTIPELLKSGRVVRQPWFRTGDQRWLDGLKTAQALQGKMEE
ncbi:MAG TPA: polysaccharide deacetylase family protein [Gammaproteobacteria bacterium]|nr:polysaccharide deacetylase family protein [Gammaproteobacteria bacterium]